MSFDLSFVYYVLTAFVLMGVLPLLASFFQFSLIGIHAKKNHLKRCEPFYPKVAIIVPAWNEAGVIGNTVDKLMGMEYPRSQLRVYVVDDASTDDTPVIMQEKEKEYEGNVFHLRRENGGQGKAHTLNHGIEIILREDWAEAFLIIDADVLFEVSALRRMTRHLVDKSIGSVTAYIKEGSDPGNLINRFIAFEYITAQAASRRAQNVLGFMACLAGGAQLHTRDNLLAIGGQIDTSSLAEDTFTTFKTQLNSRQAIFDGNAVVWAEEPDNIDGVWKQRLRWARGNLQVTKAFKNIWLKTAPQHRLGSKTFSVLWFTIMFMPFFMILSSIGLVSLYFIDFAYSWQLFKLLWVINVVVYLYVTLFSFLIDTKAGKQAWFEGLLFPGLISFVIIIFSAVPGLLDAVFIGAESNYSIENFPLVKQVIILFMYAWLSTNMIVAYSAYRFEKLPVLRHSSKCLVFLSGFGALLCAITFVSYLKEWQGAEMKWDKTEKSGKVAMPK